LHLQQYHVGISTHHRGLRPPLEHAVICFRSHDLASSMLYLPDVDII